MVAPRGPRSQAGQPASVVSGSRQGGAEDRTRADGQPRRRPRCPPGDGQPGARPKTPPGRRAAPAPRRQSAISRPLPRSRARASASAAAAASWTATPTTVSGRYVARRAARAGPGDELADLGVDVLGREPREVVGAGGGRGERGVARRLDDDERAGDGFVVELAARRVVADDVTWAPGASQAPRTTGSRACVVAQITSAPRIACSIEAAARAGRPCSRSSATKPPLCLGRVAARGRAARRTRARADRARRARAPARRCPRSRAHARRGAPAAGSERRSGGCSQPGDRRSSISATGSPSPGRTSAISAGASAAARRVAREQRHELAASASRTTARTRASRRAARRATGRPSAAHARHRGAVRAQEIGHRVATASIRSSSGSSSDSTSARESSSTSAGLAPGATPAHVVRDRLLGVRRRGRRRRAPAGR